MTSSIRLKYTGQEERFSELSITGKQQQWRRGQIDFIDPQYYGAYMATGKFEGVDDTAQRQTLAQFEESVRTFHAENTTGYDDSNRAQQQIDDCAAMVRNAPSYTSPPTTAIDVNGQTLNIGSLVRLKFPSNSFNIDKLIPRKGVWLDFGTARFFRNKHWNGVNEDSLTGILTTPAVLTNGSYYGTYDDIIITGGQFYTNGFQCGMGVRLTNMRRCLIKDLEVVQDDVVTWAMLIGGQDLHFVRPRAPAGHSTSQDFLHIMNGKRIYLHGIRSDGAGDDAVALGIDAGFGFLSDDEGIDTVYIDGQVKATRGAAIKVYSSTPDAGYTKRGREIHNVTAKLVGEAATMRNFGIGIYDYDAPANRDARRMTNIKIDFTGKIGGEAFDSRGQQTWAIKTIGCQDVEITGDIEMVSNGALPARADIVFSGFANPYKKTDLVRGTAYTATITIDGVAYPVSVTPPTGTTVDYTVGEVVAQINAQISAGGYCKPAEVYPYWISIFSNSTGATSTISITDGGLFSSMFQYTSIQTFAGESGTGATDHHMATWVLGDCDRVVMNARVKGTPQDKSGVAIAPCVAFVSQDASNVRTYTATPVRGNGLGPRASIVQSADNTVDMFQIHNVPLHVDGSRIQFNTSSVGFIRGSGQLSSLNMNGVALPAGTSNSASFYCKGAQFSGNPSGGSAYMLNYISGRIARAKIIGNEFFGITAIMNDTTGFVNTTHYLTRNNSIEKPDGTFLMDCSRKVGVTSIAAGASSVRISIGSIQPKLKYDSTSGNEMNHMWQFKFTPQDTLSSGATMKAVYVDANNVDVFVSPTQASAVRISYEIDTGSSGT